MLVVMRRGNKDHHKVGVGRKARGLPEERVKERTKALERKSQSGPPYTR